MPDMPTTVVPPASPADVRPPQTPSSRVTRAADLDRKLHAWQSRFTGGRLPSPISLVFRDWAVHMAIAPFQTAALRYMALTQWQRLARAVTGGETAITPRPGGHRFAHSAWQQRPYGLLVQAVLLGEEWFDSVVHSRLDRHSSSRRVDPPPMGPDRL